MQIRDNFLQCVNGHTYPLKRPRSSNTSVAMSTPGSQILVFKYHSPLKGTRDLGEVVHSRVGVEKVYIFLELVGGKE